MNLDKQYLQARALYNSTVAQYGMGSRVATERARDMAAIVNRILRRDLRKRRNADLEYQIRALEKFENEQRSR